MASIDLRSVNVRSVNSRNVELPSRASRGVVLASAGVLALLTVWTVFSILLAPSSTTSAAAPSRTVSQTADLPLGSGTPASDVSQTKNVKTVSIRQDTELRPEAAVRQDWSRQEQRRMDSGAVTPTGVTPVLASEPQNERTASAADTPNQLLAKAFANRQPGADALAMASETDEASVLGAAVPMPRQRPALMAARGVPVPRPRPSIDAPEEVDQTLSAAETERQRGQ